MHLIRCVELVERVRRMFGCKRQSLTTAEREASIFHRKYRQVYQACKLLNDNGNEQIHRLPGRYMKHILNTPHDDVWWQQNAEYLTEPWFIWQYAEEHELVRIDIPAKPEPQYLIISPEKALFDESVLISAERDISRPEEGTLLAYGVSSEALDALMRSLHFKHIPGGYVRKVDERAAPLIDRAVQTADKLLSNGYRVCVQEKLLYQRITAGGFEPEHRYWICAAQTSEWLHLVYPYDVHLHQYLKKMGGRWTGKQMLLPISAADRLQDVIRLYGFRMTREARMLMDVWNRAMQQATVYRPRKQKNEPPEPEPIDRFRAMLNRPAEIPEDLLDRDV